MGVVYRALDRDLDRTIALKLWAFDEREAEAALLREAQLQAQVAHPNVVTIFDAGKIGDEVYLAMEFVPGTDARQWMYEHHAGWQLVLALMLHAGRGLAAVHDRGLLHADIKPENILIGRDGRVLLADFGIARVLDREELGSSAAVRGTRAYMAPERLERRPGRGDARSDQFSFCVMLWECLHGVRPFPGEGAAELLAAMAAGRVQVADPDVPDALNQVLARGLACEPQERFDDMDQLLQALVGVTLHHEHRFGRHLRMGGWIAIGAACAVLGFAASRPALEHEHAGSPTVTQPAAAVVPRGALDIVALIERGEHEQAYALWERRYYTHESELSESSRIEREETALAVSVALFRAAARVEHTQPERASELAIYSLEIARLIQSSSAALRPDVALMAGAIEEQADELHARIKAPY